MATYTFVNAKYRYGVVLDGRPVYSVPEAFGEDILNERSELAMDEEHDKSKQHYLNLRNPNDRGSPRPTGLRPSSWRKSTTCNPGTDIGDPLIWYTMDIVHPRTTTNNFKDNHKTNRKTNTKKPSPTLTTSTIASVTVVREDLGDELPIFEYFESLGLLGGEDENELEALDALLP